MIFTVELVFIILTAIIFITQCIITDDVFIRLICGGIGFLALIGSILIVTEPSNEK